MTEHSYTPAPCNEGRFPSCALLCVALSIGIAASVIVLLLVFHTYDASSLNLWDDRLALGVAAICPVLVICAITDTSQSIIPRTLSTLALSLVAWLQIIFEASNIDIKTMVILASVLSIGVAMYGYRRLVPSVLEANIYRSVAVISYVCMVFAANTVGWPMAILIPIPAVALWLSHTYGNHSGGGDPDLVFLCMTVIALGSHSVFDAFTALYTAYRYQLLWLLMISIGGLIVIYARRAITATPTNQGIHLAPIASIATIAVVAIRAFEVL